MIFDSGRHKYELLDHWPKLPEGISLNDAVAMSVDSQDRVFIFSRQEINKNTPPVTVFDREGTCWPRGGKAGLAGLTVFILVLATLSTAQTWAIIPCLNGHRKGSCS
jgi:hypothetical protein